MRYLSLFSGIEAASVAWKPLGWECVAVAEIEPFPCAVLRHHYPEVPNLGDVTRITPEQIGALGRVDLVIFGFPCQDLSLAGQRKGLKDADGTLTRSGLFFYAERIARWCGARWTVAENVPGLFSSDEGRDFATVVGELAGAEFDVPGDGWRTAGVAEGPRGLVEWVVLDAQWFGLAQRRKRVFLVRDSGEWANRPPLFLNAARLRWHFKESRETREGIAPTLEGRAGRSGCNEFAAGLAPTLPARTQGGGGLGTDFDCDGGVIHGICHEVAQPLLAKGNSSHRADAESYVAHALRADGFDASEDGTGRGTPIVPQSLPCVSSKWSKGTGGPSGDEVQNLIAFSSKDSGNNANGGMAPAIAFQPRVARNGRGAGEPVVPALNGANAGATSDSRPCVATTAAVRRLLPEECESLQGFPRGYTKINDKTADGPRYKALGNSFAVPVVAWIGKQIEAVEGGYGAGD